MFMNSNKSRFDSLDGLRGVAALMVLFYHVFNDAKAFFVGPVSEFCHGFLGVDFFFILSGFVMGYAYDSQWGRMSLGGFVRRRLIRLHPMVVAGVLLGVIAFLLQGSVMWDGTSVSLASVLRSAVLSLFLIPSPAEVEIRGFTEIFPLNGPHWSLFFEYLGSLLYALLLRRLSTRWLKVWVIGSMISLLVFSLVSTDGGIAYGWGSMPENLLGGALRMLYAYPMGLLLARLYRSGEHKPLGSGIFLICSLLLILLQGMPSFDGRCAETAFQLLCAFLVFPLIVWYSARSVLSGRLLKTASFCGRLSYPLYAIHYPFVYIFISYIQQDEAPYVLYSQPWLPAIITIAVSLLTAVAVMLCYDEPLRRWMGKMG